MAFVIDRFWLPLLLAAIIGFMVAWATCGRSEKSWVSSWLPLAILVAIAGAVLASEAVLPGQYGLWLETALLMFASYLGGCCIACMARRLLFGREQLEVPGPQIALAGADGTSVEVAPMDAIEAARTAAKADVAAVPVDNSLSALVAASGAGIVATATSLASEAASGQSATIVPLGVKPLLLDRPRNGKGDDLTLIWGVADKLQDRMNKMGIWHFDQIAAWKPDHVKWFEGQMEGFKGRIERDKWIEQCEKLAKGWQPDSKVGSRPKG